MTKHYCKCDSCGKIQAMERRGKSFTITEDDKWVLPFGWATQDTIYDLCDKCNKTWNNEYITGMQALKEKLREKLNLGAPKNAE